MSDYLKPLDIYNKKTYNITKIKKEFEMGLVKKMKFKKIDVADNGEFVACDFCNEGENTLGGVLVGSYALCGDCAAKITLVEEIDRYFDPSKTFRQNVLNYRQEVYGETEAKIEFYTWEDYLNNMLD